MKKLSSNAYCPRCGTQHPDRSRFPVVPAAEKYCEVCQEKDEQDAKLAEWKQRHTVGPAFDDEEGSREFRIEDNPFIY